MGRRELTCRTTTSRGARRWAAAAGTAAVLATSLVTAPTAVADRQDDVLTTGERLEQGDSLVSPSGRYRLEVTHTAELTLTERGNWLTGQNAVVDALAFEVAYVVLQADGNLVAYGGAGQAVLDFGTNGTGATAVRMQDDRNIVLFGAAGQVVADTSSYRDSFLFEGDALLPGDQVAAELVGTRLVMQADGNLVLYRGRTALWSSGTQGNPGAGAVQQYDGNLVVYSSAESGRRALWSSGTGGYDPSWPAVFTTVIEDTELSVNEVYDDSGVALWGSNWASSVLAAGDELAPGDRRASPGGRCVLVMQPDENLVEYCAGRAVFATGVPRTANIPSETYALMQPDGNLVVYRQLADGSAPTPLFNTGSRTPGSRLVVQSDDNVVVVSPGGRPVWSRLTGPVR